MHVYRTVWEAAIGKIVGCGMWFCFTPVADELGDSGVLPVSFNNRLLVGYEKQTPLVDQVVHNYTQLTLR